MTFTSLPNWQESLNSRLVQRLNRPLTRSGMLDNQMAQDIIDRSNPLHNRLPLLDQQMQRWAKVVDLETPPLAIVYAQLPSSGSQPELPPGTSSVPSPEDSPHVTHQSLAPRPLVKAQWVTTSPSLDQADLPTRSNPRSPAAIANDEEPNHRAEIPTQPVQAVPVLDASDPITEHPIPVTHPLPVVRQSMVKPAQSTAMAIVRVGAKQVVSPLESPQLLNGSIQTSIDLPLKSDSSQINSSQPSSLQTNSTQINPPQIQRAQNNLTQTNSSQPNQPQINSSQPISLQENKSQINPPQINLSYFSSSHIQPPPPPPSPQAGGGEIVQRASLDLDQGLRTKVAEATTLEQASINTLQLNPVQHHEITPIQYSASTLEKPSFSQQVESMVEQGSAPYGIGVAVRGIHADARFHFSTQPIQNLDSIKPIDLTYPISTQIPAIPDISVGKNSIFNNKQTIDSYPSYLSSRHNSDSDTIHFNTHVVTKSVAPLPAETSVHGISASPLSISPAAFPIQRKIDPRDSSSSVSLQSSGVKEQPLMLHRPTDHVPDLISIREQSTIPNSTSSNNPIFSQIQRKVDHAASIAPKSIPEITETSINKLQISDDSYHVKSVNQAEDQSKSNFISVTPLIQPLITTNTSFQPFQYTTQQKELKTQSIAQKPEKKTFSTQQNSPTLMTTSTRRSSRSKSSVASELDIPAHPRSQPRGFVSPKPSAKRPHRTPQPLHPEAPVDPRSQSTAIAAIDHTSRRNTQPQRTVAHPLSQRQTQPISKFANQEQPARSPISARLNAAPNPAMSSQPRSQVQTYMQTDFAPLTQVLAPLNQLTAHQDAGHLHTVIPTLRSPVVMPNSSSSSLAIAPTHQPQTQPQTQPIIQRKVDHTAIAVSHPEVGSIIPPRSRVAEQATRTHHSSPIHAPISHSIATDGSTGIAKSTIQPDRSSEAPALVFQSPLALPQQPTQLTAIAPNDSPLHGQISRDIKSDTQWWHSHESHTKNRFQTSNQLTQILPFIHQSLNLNVENSSLARFGSQHFSHSMTDEMNTRQFHKSAPGSQLSNHQIQRKVDTSQFNAIAVQSQPAYSIKQTSTYINDSQASGFDIQPTSHQPIHDQLIHSINNQSVFSSPLPYITHNPLQVSSTHPTQDTHSLKSGITSGLDRDQTGQFSRHNSLIVRNPIVQHTGIQSSGLTPVNAAANTRITTPQSVHSHDSQTQSLRFSQVGQQLAANGDQSRDRPPHTNIDVPHETQLPLDLPLINTNNFIEQSNDQSTPLQPQKWDSTHQLITPLATRLHKQSKDLPFIPAIAHDPLLNPLELKQLELTRVKLHQSASSPPSQWADHQSVPPTTHPTREQRLDSFGDFAPLPQAHSRHLDGQREMRDTVAPQLDPLPAPPIPKLKDPPSLPIVSVETEPLTIFEPLVLPSTSTHSTNTNHPTRQPSTTPSQPSFSNPSLTDSSSLTTHTASPSYPSFTTNSPHIQPVQLQPQTAIAADSPAPPIDLDALVAQVERRLMKRFVVESERRGKKKWH